MKIFMIERGEEPRVRKMAMSACLSVTVITSVETRLNAATAMIRVRMMNIIFFSVCTAANQVAFAIDQSRTTSSPGMLRLSSCATCGALCMSTMRRRSPDGPSKRSIFSASSRWMNARPESNS